MENAGSTILSPSVSLKFFHNCVSSGCADTSCLLCSQNQSRRCKGNFASKYLSGDTILSACRSTLYLEIVDIPSGRLLNNPQDTIGHIELSCVDSRAVNDHLSVEDLGRLPILLNQAGNPLLTAKGPVNAADGHIVLKVKGSVIDLPDSLSILGSSEALLSGQRSRFMLMARAVSTEGVRLPVVGFSEPFAVATPRVRTAIKKPIPHLGDHVSKLNAVGVATQQKLKNLPKAFAQLGVWGHQLPLTSVTTVGEFQTLARWAEAEQSRLTDIKRTLKFGKGWEEARDHAYMAVGDDALLRVWFEYHDTTSGLLFGCRGGAPILTEPLAQLKWDVDAGVIRASRDVDIPETLKIRAVACWYYHKHPGWGVLKYPDSSVFAELFAQMPQSCLEPHFLVDPQGYPSDPGSISLHVARSHPPVESLLMTKDASTELDTNGGVSALQMFSSAATIGNVLEPSPPNTSTLHPNIPKMIGKQPNVSLRQPELPSSTLPLVRLLSGRGFPESLLPHDWQANFPPVPLLGGDGMSLPSLTSADVEGLLNDFNPENKAAILKWVSNASDLAKGLFPEGSFSPGDWSKLLGGLAEEIEQDQPAQKKRRHDD